MKVLIVQGELPEYRIPLFEAIAQHPDIELTVAHGDKASPHVTQFRQLQLPCRSFLGFRWLGKLSHLAKSSHILVLMFDLRWPTILWQALVQSQKSILWGQGFGRRKTGRKLRVYLANRAKAVLVYEGRAQQQMISEGIKKEKVFYTGNTVEVLRPGRKEGERTQFLFVGRLQERKRIDEILDAFASITNKINAHIGVTIIGGGELADDLLQQATKLGIADRVRIIGPIHDETLLEAEFSKAIAYVSPGHVGLGVLHSFAYGVPVITSKNANHGPEVENLIDGATGRLYQRGTEELGEILSLFANDSDWVKKLGEAALARYLTERSMKQMADRFIEAIMFASN